VVRCVMSRFFIRVLRTPDFCRPLPVHNQVSYFGCELRFIFQGSLMLPWTSDLPKKYGLGDHHEILSDRRRWRD
jgi:hypothetical protein